MGCKLQYSCTVPLPEGNGNIDEEPLFAGLGRLSEGSPCRGGGSKTYALGTDLDGDPWLDPPSMGCDEYIFSSATGALEVAISAQYTQVVAGFEVEFIGEVVGRSTHSVWSFGDGTVVGNRRYVSHKWDGPGTYVVELRTFNATHVDGVSATTLVDVLGAEYYVKAGHTNAVAPYDSWDTAASTIQDAINETAVGALVRVADGIYDMGGAIVDGDLTNRIAVTNSITVRSENGAKSTLIGGSGSRWEIRQYAARMWEKVRYWMASR